LRDLPAAALETVWVFLVAAGKGLHVHGAIRDAIPWTDEAASQESEAEREQDASGTAGHAKMAAGRRMV